MSDTRRKARLALLRLAAGPVGALGQLIRPRKDAGPALRVLLIRPDHLGDMLLASPAATVLREALPEARVDWLVGPWAAEVTRRAAGGAEVMSLEFPGFTRRPKSWPLEPYDLLIGESARLRALAYDAALILRPDHWWGALLASLAGIPRRFGYAVEECEPFLTDMLPPPTGHAVEANLALARLAATGLGGTARASSALPSPRFEITPNEESWARRQTRTASPTARGRRPLVAMHPGSGAALKSWPATRWSDVGRALWDRARAEVILTGSTAERPLADEIAAGVASHPVVLAGKTSLGQLAALFARCDLVIGGDSGPLHLAAAVGTPTLRLYGPTDPVEFGPWPPGDQHVALAAGLACQPCRMLESPPCGAVERPACLMAIDASTVVDAALRALARRGDVTAGPDADATAPAEPC